MPSVSPTASSDPSGDHANERAWISAATCTPWASSNPLASLAYETTERSATREKIIILSCAPGDFRERMHTLVYHSGPDCQGTFGIDSLPKPESRSRSQIRARSEMSHGPSGHHLPQLEVAAMIQGGID